jgi:hypothetical protein
MKRTAWLLLGGAFLAGGWLLSPAAAQDKGGKGPVVELGNLKSRAPADWKEVEPSPIQKQGGRIKSFVLPKAGDDKYDADVLIFYFGGQGGSVKENVKRWKDMFIPPQGKTPDDVAKTEEFKAGKASVTYVDIQGTYKFKKAPFVPDDQAERRPNYRMVGVYFDCEGGPYFIRFVGPAKTVEQYKKGFDEWLKAFE